MSFNRTHPYNASAACRCAARRIHTLRLVHGYSRRGFKGHWRWWKKTRFSSKLLSSVSRANSPSAPSSLFFHPGRFNSVFLPSGSSCISTATRCRLCTNIWTPTCSRKTTAAKNRNWTTPAPTGTLRCRTSRITSQVGVRTARDNDVIRFVYEQGASRRRSDITWIFGA